MAQQALASPVEITTTNDTVSVNYNAGGAAALTLTNGTYASPLTMLYQFDFILGAHNAALYAYLNTDYKVVLASTTATFTVAWTDAPLMRILGFRDDLAAATTHTATDTLGHMWIPPYYSADLNHPADDTDISGGNAIDGTFSGIALAPGLYTRKHEWQAVDATNVYKSACEESYAYPTPPGTAFYYPEEERCLEQFTINALTASPTGTEGLSIKGAYYIENLIDYTGNTGAASNCPSSMDGGGHRFQLDYPTTSTDTADNYIFCHLRPARWTNPTPTLPTYNSLYNVGVELVSAVGGVPTWSKP